jgi:hypothetical protein
VINPTQIDPIGAIAGAEGWHANVPEDDMTEALAVWRMTPATPLRVYAGDAAPFPLTAFLRFPDETMGRMALGIVSDA